MIYIFALNGKSVEGTCLVNSLTCTLQYTHDIHAYSTKSSSVIHQSNYFDTGISNPTFTLYVQKANLVKYGGRLVKVLGPLFWNELPTHIHVSASVQAFKEAVKKSYIAQYE